MAQYFIESPHTPEECLHALDEYLENKAKTTREKLTEFFHNVRKKLDEKQNLKIRRPRRRLKPGNPKGRRTRRSTAGFPSTPSGRSSFVRAKSWKPSVSPRATS
ncbi:MAG: hypothetical protein P8Z49_12980 [Acidobacteriota bacterium]